MCLCVQQICLAVAATSGRDTTHSWIQDSAGMCIPYKYQIEKGSPITAKMVNAFEKE